MSEEKKSEKTVEPGTVGSGVPSIQVLDGPPASEWIESARNPQLSEDSALALLTRTDLTSYAIEELAKNLNALKSRKVKFALASHPRTPRHIAIPLARRLYTFDLMKLALAPNVPADIKIAVEDILIARLGNITIGERLTLARRASGRVTAALLLPVEDGKSAAPNTISVKSDAELKLRVIEAALQNPRLTEALVVGAVLQPAADAILVDAVSHHATWNLRRQIRLALLRTEHLPLAQAIEFGSEFSAAQLKELLAGSRLPEVIKEQILRRTVSCSSPAHE